MFYVARAAVQLEQDVASYEKSKWYHIKTLGSVEYRWRLSNGLLYEVIVGIFSDKYEALKCAKQMYVTLLYSMLIRQVRLSDAGCNSYETRFFDKNVDSSVDEYIEKENFFFWNHSYVGGDLGPSVYEVEKSIDEFNTYRFYSVDISSQAKQNLDFINIDEYIFTYSREAQSLLSTVILADKINDDGMKMTIYCGLLEHLSQGRKKDQVVLSVIDELIEHAKQSVLGDEEKKQLISYLECGKDISSRKKCRELIARYAPKTYGGYRAQQVFDNAYSIRSTFSHGDVIDLDTLKAARYIKHLVLDVVKGYMREKEKTNI